MYAQDNNSLPVWTFVTSLLTHISINSQPFLVGIVSIKQGAFGSVFGTFSVRLTVSASLG